MPATDDDIASERAARRVEVDHGDDGMSWLQAYLPTVAVAAIDGRLGRVARALVQVDPDTGEVDGRTVEQKRADLLVSWATCSDNLMPGDLCVDVAVVATTATCEGRSDEPAVDLGGGFSLPAPMVTDLGRFRRVETGGRVTRTGRYATGQLARLVRYRDRICQAPGCTRPAMGCDVDHRVPHPVGETSTENLWCLCRKHHLMKTDGLLEPVVERGTWRWRLRDGRVVGPAPPPPWEPGIYAGYGLQKLFIRHTFTHPHLHYCDTLN